MTGEACTGSSKHMANRLQTAIDAQAHATVTNANLAEAAATTMPLDPVAMASAARAFR